MTPPVVAIPLLSLLSSGLISGWVELHSISFKKSNSRSSKGTTSMATNETAAPSKNGNASSPMQEPPPIYPYPDWASMQAYYGPGLPVPPPYLNATVAPGHPPYPYMWSPQPMIPPFGGPYSALYPHGGVPHMASLVSPEILAKSQRVRKKSKVVDKTSVSVGNGSAESAGANEDRMSHSGVDLEGGSSDGSDGNNDSDGSKNQINRNSADIPESELGTMPNISLGVELKASSITKFKPSGAPLPSTAAMDERELKREKRKQSNRESARRSRLRKQAEAEELSLKVGTLTAENTALRSEITQLTESSAKLRTENSALMEKLEVVHLNQAEEIDPEIIGRVEAPSIFIENLLSRIDNSSSNGGNKEEDEPQDNNSGKLHELLDSKSRTDAVAAS